MAAVQTRKRKQKSEPEDKYIQVGNKIKYYQAASTEKKFSNNTTTTNIFRGVFENTTNVFIRRFQTAILESNTGQKKKEFERDMELLRLPERTSHMHENFTRYFCCEKDVDYYYVAIEWCICSVEDLYVRDRKGYNWEKEEIPMDLIKASLKKKEILRQATKGVAFLHAMGFVHRNLKPSNFLIAQIQLEKTKDKTRFKYLVKVSDFRMSKDLVTNPEDSGRKGSDGWISPDSRPKDDATDNTQVSNDDTDIIQTNPSEDVFILGCFFYYVLTNGKHPFGRLRNTRITNINTKTFEVYRDDWAPFKVEKGEANNVSLQDEIDYQAGTKEEMQQAVSLLRDMLKFNPNERPALKKILDRAYFLPDDYYKLYDLPEIKPGLCVIFNQEIFDYEKKNRYGTEKDLEALSAVFKEFGFEVESHDNLKAQQLCDEINNLAGRKFSEYACLVVCILSHGNEGKVCGTEYHQQVSVEDAKKQFNNFKCHTLSGKPKIWIIQSCQGNLKQEDLKKSTAPLAPIKPKETTPQPTNQGNLPNTDSVSLGIQCQQVVSQPPDLLPDIPRPPMSDFLDIRATVPGFVSYRYKGKGSTLIQNLCKQLRATFLNEGEKSTRHLEDLLKMVQKSISEEKNFCPATEDDKKKFETMKNIGVIIYLKDLEPVTEEDVKKHNNKIDPTFKKYFHKGTNKLIYFRPYNKQTIEWRSTLMNFIRFEKK